MSKVKEDYETCFVSSKIDKRIKAMKKLKEVSMQIHMEHQDMFVSDKKNKNLQ